LVGMWIVLAFLPLYALDPDKNNVWVMSGVHFYSLLAETRKSS
jgi:hypothetical protein